VINELDRRAGPLRLEHIDMLRGLAAFLVLCSHLRAYTFTNFSSLTSPGLFTKIFYGATGLGHQAVIIFFAMSGFLVGGKALNDMVAQRWSWSHYILRRLTRLLIVVVPALAATAVLDSIGIALTGGAGYDGSLYGIYASGPQVTEPLDYSITTFIGNLTFLQTIYVPVFGTNGPMWSLTNEFWYYVIFPLAATIFLVRYGSWEKLLAVAFTAIAILVLPWGLLESGLIWVAGAGTAWLTGRTRLAPLIRRNMSRILGLGLAIIALISTKYIQQADYADLLFGLSIAFGLPMLALLPSPDKAYRSFTRATAEVSYTLYLTHFPFLTLIVMVEFAPHRFQPSFLSSMIYGVLLIAALAWAVAFWWCFERNTDRVFWYLSARLLERHEATRKLGVERPLKP
jgi:peptidoglycan/LPS O-acetylase OafA/YrhL